MLNYFYFNINNYELFIIVIFFYKLGIIIIINPTLKCEVSAANVTLH